MEINLNKGVLFPVELQKELKEKFHFADKDPQFGERLFFDNSGGALRLKSAVERRGEIECFPDCPDRNHNQAKQMNALVYDGTKDIISKQLVKLSFANGTGNIRQILPLA